MQENNSPKTGNHHSFQIVPLVLALGLIALGTYFVSNLEKNRTITVSGTSTSEVANEIASFSVIVEANNEDKQIAVEEVTSQAESIISSLKDFGIPEKDLETVAMNVYQREEPILEKGVTVYEPGDWYASTNVNIKLRDVAKVTELMALLSSFDATSMWGPNFEVDSEKLNDGSLLQSAVKDARIKADAMAAQVGSQVGGVKMIVESNGYESPVTFMKAEAMGLGGGGMGFPSEPGITEVQKHVIVTFWLK